MSPERWEQIEAVFAAAAAQETGTREAFLAQTCTGDPELRAVVDALLTYDALVRLDRLLNAACATTATVHEATAADGPTRSVPFPPARLTAATVPQATSADGAVADRPTVPGYELLEELGRGGTGVVYRAVHRALKRGVALKMVLSGSLAGSPELARFRREAESVARMKHPNIVEIYEIGTAGGRPYLALEFVDGGTLAQSIRHTPLLPRQAAEILQILARAVHHAHDQGVIHRDLKPANILLTRDGTPKISDFGLAKHLAEDAGQTQTGAIVGTPSYMAPEQADGRVHDIGRASDVYALGAILYECLTGRPPFRASSIMETLEQVRDQEPVPPSRLQPKLPRSLETICLKCLEKEPQKRYASADALAEDLRRFLNHERIFARPPNLAARFWLWCQRPERIQHAGAFMVFISLVCSVWCLGGIVVIACGGFDELDQAQRRTASVSLMMFIFVFYLPLLGIGLGTTMARRRRIFFLGAGVLVSALLIVTAFVSMVGFEPIMGLVRTGGLFDGTAARYPSFLLLGIMITVQFLGYCVALVAYYANPRERR